MPAPDAPGFLRPAGWQLDYLFSLGAAGWAVHAAVVTLTAAVQDPARPDVQQWLWAMLGLTAAMIGICLTGARTAHKRLAGLLHTGTTALVAVTWSLGAVSFAQASLEHLLLYTLALGGTALGAVSAQHAVMRSCMVSIWLSIPGLATGHWLFDAGPRGTANAAMVLLFGCVLSMLAYRMSRFLRDNHALARSLADEVVASQRERARADEANRAKSRFIAYASHDLRQPVHAIGMLTELLRGQKLSRRTHETVGQIAQSVQSLSRQFQSLMDLSALELGRLEPKPVVVALRPLLDSLARQNAPAAGNRGCTIAVRGAALDVVTDPALVENIVQNVISNAIKYAPGTRITLGTKRRGRTASIVVADRGPGMSESFRAAAFEEFRRAASQMPGLGLGLPLVARYSALLGLEARLHSRPGTGTVVEIAGLAHASGPADRPPQSSARNWLSGLRVLLVDDDAAAREATGRLLESWGCVVMGLAATPAALPEADIVLTDFAGGRGALAERLIAACRTRAPACPVIVVTGSDDPAAHRAVAGGRGLVLQKPVRPAQLRAAITSLTMAGGAAGAQ
ncbi:ATP-binding protein [Aquibium sp. A9E412]|uniref:ATP-binding response regulator n=1 Tax=Aquibium sp. A9E412 TaxID=2976767 RepID=UPI0025B00D84|nr:hybrid sensor histidine kinase/response regulator [Aquibium sp. A9E412]MDN2566325.1 ATP-binding protein [Aquibium sp. A9E412]